MSDNENLPAFAMASSRLNDAIAAKALFEASGLGAPEIAAADAYIEEKWDALAEAPIVDLADARLAIDALFLGDVGRIGDDATFKLVNSLAGLFLGLAAARAEGQTTFDDAMLAAGRTANIELEIPADELPRTSVPIVRRA